MKSLDVVLTSKLNFSCDALRKLSNTAYIGTQKLLMYPNSKYLENEKYGYSNYGVPSHLYTYKIDRDVFTVFRGELDKLREYLLKFDIKINLTDKTVVTEDISFDHSNIVLREDQNEFLNGLAPFNNGIGLAYTSMGKTVMSLELVRRIKQRTLILVHTTFLQKQWIEEMTNPKLFNIDKKRIGGAGGVFGGKKFKVGDINISLYHSAKKDKIISEYKKAGIGLIIVDETQKAVINDIQTIVNSIPARNIFGVTASIDRKDKKEFMVKACIGPVRYEAIETSSDSKILANIKFTPTQYENEDYEDDNNYTNLINDMALDKDRNILICKNAIHRVKMYNDLVIIFVERVIQAGILAKYLSKFRVELLLGPVTGLKKIKEDQDALSRVPKGTIEILENYDYKTAYDRVKELGSKKQLDFIIGTQKMEVGLSIRPVSYGIVTTPIGNNLERFNQVLGRIERTHSEEQAIEFGVKSTPTLEVMVDKTRVSKNARFAIEAKYADRVLSNRQRIKEEDKQIVRLRKRT